MPRHIRKITSLFFILLFLVYPANIDAQKDGQIVKLKKIVIDPGHGGKHPGAVSKDGKILEKDLTLSIALRFGELIKKNCPDVEVIYTRTSDKFVAVDERTNIANKNKADLFISIHINSLDSPAANGTETFVMGVDKSNANMAVVRTENSVITLEDDYSSTYAGFEPDNPESYIIFSLLQNSHFEQSIILATLIQNKLKEDPFKRNRGVKQGPLLVLWRCTMPAVLVELGFMSNPEDLKILSNKNNHDKLSQAMFEAFLEYKKQYEKGVDISETLDNNTITQKSFRIQVFTSERVLKEGDPEFKDLKDISYHKDGSLYKYATGKFQKVEDARKELAKVQKIFPDAFIISR